jgi:hypothetical protein
MADVRRNEESGRGESSGFAFFSSLFSFCFFCSSLSLDRLIYTPSTSPSISLSHIVISAHLLVSSLLPLPLSGFPLDNDPCSGFWSQLS